MPVSSEIVEEQRTAAMPVENQMFERENFDRKGLRMDLADPTDLAAGTEYIEREDKELPDPRSVSMPVGPTGYTEVGGGGMDTIRLDGERWRTYRYAHGFELHREDLGGVERQRDYVMETFDLLFDLNFLYGMEGTDWNGVVDEIRTRASANGRVYDCDDYDNDGSGNESGKQDFSAVPEDLMVEIMKQSRGDLLDLNSGWDLAVGGHTALTSLRFSAGEDTDVERGPSFRERMEDADVVQNFLKMPFDTQLDYLPEDADANIPDFETFPIVSEETANDPSGEALMGYDELFLIPDTDAVLAGDLWDVRETAAPEHYGPIESRRGKLAHDYVSRFTAKADPTGEYPTFPDFIVLQNVSDLFGA